MRTPIYFRRGNKTDLPVLNAGEPGFAVDTKELFIGHSSGNVRIFVDAKSLAQNGYVTLPSGLILQWGKTADFTIAANSSITFTYVFPLAFPANIFGVFPVGDAQGATGNGIGAAVFLHSLTGAGIMLLNTTAASQTYRARVFAIGN